MSVICFCVVVSTLQFAFSHSSLFYLFTFQIIHKHCSVLITTDQLCLFTVAATGESGKFVVPQHMAYCDTE